MDKSSSAKCLLYSVVVKWGPRPTGRGRRSRDDQSRSWRYSFHKYFTSFFYLFLFFNYFTLSLFSILFLPTTFTHTHDPRPTTHDPRPTTHDPRPTTHDLYPRPLPTTHDPGHLATLLFTFLFSFPPETPHTQARYTLSGTLRWHDGENKNENENVKQAMGWISKTTTLHVHHAYLYISLQIMHDNDGKMPDFTFYGGRKQATAKFSFSFWTWIRFLGIRLNKSSLTFDKDNHELEKSRWYWKNANSLFWRCRDRRRRGIVNSLLWSNV